MSHNELKNCPFCDHEMHVKSNRDWHRVAGEHASDCPFGDDHTMMVPATPELRQWMVAAWNSRAAKDAPALEAVPVHFYRMPAGSGQWIETTAGCIEAIKGMMQHYPYEFRTLYTAPAKQEAAPFEAQEGLTKAAIAWWKNHRPCNWTEAQHVENPVVNCQSGADEELAVQVAAIIATKQSPAAPTNAKESTS